MYGTEVMGFFFCPLSLDFTFSYSIYIYIRRKWAVRSTRILDNRYGTLSKFDVCWYSVQVKMGQGRVFLSHTALWGRLKRRQNRNEQVPFKGAVETFSHIPRTLKRQNLRESMEYTSNTFRNRSCIVKIMTRFYIPCQI